MGGQYAYLREAYHPAVAFLYGWVLLLVIQTGGMAAVSITFARYFLELTGLHTPDWVVAVVALAALTLINCLGCKNRRTHPERAYGDEDCRYSSAGNCRLCFSGKACSRNICGERDWSLTSFGGAMVPVLFAYGGWQTANFIAAEVKEPKKNLPRGLLIGMLGVLILYTAVNWVCLRSLGPQALAASSTPATAVMRLALGQRGADVHCGGNRHFDAGISEPIDFDRASRVLCYGRRRSLLPRGSVARPENASAGRCHRPPERVDNSDCAFGPL